MLNMGDEVRRSQGGNGNPWCRDDGTTWFDWQGPLRHPDTLRFVQRLTGLRRAHAGLRRARSAGGLTWHGTRLGDPGWHDPAVRALAVTVRAERGPHADLHVIANMADEVLAFELPAGPDRRWRRAVDTGLPGSLDIADPGEEVPISGGHYLANPHTVVVLVSGAA
jgi:glycogen operon protein